MAEVNFPSYRNAFASTAQFPNPDNGQLTEPFSQESTASAPEGGGRPFLWLSAYKVDSNENTRKHSEAVPEHCRSQKKLSEYQVNIERRASSWLSSRWDFFVPPPQTQWIFPATGPMQRPFGSSTTTQVITRPSAHPTLRLRHSGSLAPPGWPTFNPHFERSLNTLFDQLKDGIHDQGKIAELYWKIYDFFRFYSSGEITGTDINKLREFIKSCESAGQNSPKTGTSEALKNLANFLKVICLSHKCYEFLSRPPQSRSPGEECQQLLEEISRLDPEGLYLQRYQKEIDRINKQPASKAPAQAIAGAVGGIGISDEPSREKLLKQATNLKEKQHELKVAIEKLDDTTEHGSKMWVTLNKIYQKRDAEITQTVETYRLLYGEEMLTQIDQWKDAAIQALASEGSATVKSLKELQGKITPDLAEIECFFYQSTHIVIMSYWNRLTDALKRTHSQEVYRRLREWIDSDREIQPNQINPDDDLHLYFIFQDLKQNLERQSTIYNMSGISDEQKAQAETGIANTTDKLEKIITIFRNIIHRYERLKSDHQYPVQLAEMEEAAKKGRRVITSTLSPAARERQYQINSLNNPELDSEQLMDMSDEDFQVVFTLLSGNELTADHTDTMKKNNWQLTDNRSLVVQRGHERVTVLAIGRRYQLIDSASNTVIGVINQKRWDRIHQRQENEAQAGVGQITRQMVYDDFYNFRTTPEERREYDDMAYFFHTVREEGGAVVPNPTDSERRHDQPVASEILQYQRRHFQK